jgi:aryl-alcohol dehydrogenase-like predicted oxidoreductase
VEYRLLGRTGLKVSSIGFGCGAVGGLLVRGDYAEMIRTVARAVELGVNYFDTAAIYGDGLSETNLGRVLMELRPDVLVGTKVMIREEDLDDIAGAVIRSVERSLRRLGRECVDLLQLHNPLAVVWQSGRNWLAADALAAVGEAFERLRDQGKTRFWGINGIGETAALHAAVGLGQAQTIQCCYNLINPSAGAALPAGFPFQDYDRLIERAAGREMGVIAIRVLAGGALSGTADRHANAAAAVDPIASGRDFAEDVAHAGRFAFLVAEGHAESLAEAAIRFALSKPEVSTVLVGISDGEQLEQAARFAGRGPLGAAAQARLPALWASPPASSHPREGV